MSSLAGTKQPTGSRSFWRNYIGFNDPSDIQKSMLATNKVNWLKGNTLYRDKQIRGTYTITNLDFVIDICF